MTDKRLVHIVDDEDGVRRSASFMLKTSGFAVQTWPSGVAFLKEARHVEPGCVLLDVRMPGMKGPELYRAMLARGLDLPVIFLTGHGDVPTSVDAMKLGAVDFLEKPVGGEVLVGAIRAALARQTERRRLDAERREIEARFAKLSPREREVMSHVIAGRLNKQIAADLGISLKTVKAHRAKVMEKTGAGSVAALVDLCRAGGIHAAAVQRIDPEPLES